MPLTEASANITLNTDFSEVESASASLTALADTAERAMARASQASQEAARGTDAYHESIQLAGAATQGLRRDVEGLRGALDRFANTALSVFSWMARTVRGPDAMVTAAFEDRRRRDEGVQESLAAGQQLAGNAGELRVRGQ